MDYINIEDDLFILEAIKITNAEYDDNTLDSAKLNKMNMIFSQIKDKEKTLKLLA